VSASVYASTILTCPAFTVTLRGFDDSTCAAQPVKNTTTPISKTRMFFPLEIIYPFYIYQKPVKFQLALTCSLPESQAGKLKPQIEIS
jgi:hypothetical protein